MKKDIALVTGGYSGEAEISYQSAASVEKNIDHEKFNLFKIDINKNGWFYINEEERKSVVDRSDFSLNLNGKKIIFDAVLMGIHGTPGEDGKLQGYFDMLGIPYTSCDAATSSVTFNKRFTVAVAAFSGVRVARSVLLVKNKFTSADELVKDMKFPVFVKPNNGGSSIGMSKVNLHSEELGTAIEKAFLQDDQVLVEEFIEGREFTIGVFQAKGEVVCLPVTEIISKKDFFDYDAKYLGMSEEITPAKIDESVAEKIRFTAKKVYTLFNCRGIVRIDFIYNETIHEPFMLEINTVPGQTEASLVPQQVKAMGWSLKDFYTALIEDALMNNAK